MTGTQHVLVWLGTMVQISTTQQMQNLLWGYSCHVLCLARYVGQNDPSEDEIYLAFHWSLRLTLARLSLASDTKLWKSNICQVFTQSYWFSRRLLVRWCFATIYIPSSTTKSCKPTFQFPFLTYKVVILFVLG